MRMTIPVVLAAANLLHGAVVSPIVTSEFIYESADFPQCHASTIVEVKEGFVAAWFGGSREGAKDVRIWVARNENGHWTKPVAVADGVDGANRFPTWNPVLFQPNASNLTLFYKVGPKPDAWWGMQKVSHDAGLTWSAAARLPQGILGPIKNKPIQLANGEILCPSSTENEGWRVHFERSKDGQSWQKSAPVGDPQKFGAIQPSVLVHSNGVLQALCRSRKGKIVETWSRDSGKTWSNLQPTELPNPNSGLDAVTLRDGRHVLVYNHTSRGRSPLNVAISRDGKAWEPWVTLESAPGEYSYPAVIQAANGEIHITYTWKRERIKHVALDLSTLKN